MNWHASIVKVENTREELIKLRDKIDIAVQSVTVYTDSYDYIYSVIVWSTRSSGSPVDSLSVDQRVHV